MTYTHLTLIERYQIFTLRSNHFSLRAIAKQQLARSVSTISRELRRNRDLSGYCPAKAHQKADRRIASNQRRIDPSLWIAVKEKLALQWSLEQIAAHIPVSPQSIYRYIDRDKEKGGELYRHLRCQNRRKRRYGNPETRGQIPRRRSIHNRDPIVEKRARIGDLEIDSIIGKRHRQSLVSIVDRQSGYLCLKRCYDRKSQSIKEATIELLTSIKPWLKTITADNGKEFSQHESIAKALAIDFYFADPYAAWQRGSNENTNGLVRQYIPKGSDFDHYSDADIEAIMNRLNNRPRKRLGFIVKSVQENLSFYDLARRARHLSVNY